jgi:hypothetical protein
VLLYTGHVLQIYDNDPHLINTFIDTRKTEENEEEEVCSERHYVFTGGGRKKGQKKYWSEISQAVPAHPSYNCRLEAQ